MPVWATSTVAPWRCRAMVSRSVMLFSSSTTRMRCPADVIAPPPAAHPSRCLSDDPAASPHGDGCSCGFA